MLGLGHPYNKTVKLWRHFDLAGKPARGLKFLREIEHRVFHVLFGWQFSGPLRINVHMTRCAGAGAPTIRIDSRYKVFYCTFHDGPPGRDVNDVFFAVMFDVGDFRHG